LSSALSVMPPPPERMNEPSRSPSKARRRTLRPRRWR
jgi:hypothetical protein